MYATSSSQYLMQPGVQAVSVVRNQITTIAHQKKESVYEIHTRTVHTMKSLRYM